MLNKNNYKNWENNIYAKRREINSYPYDLVVSIISRLFSSLSTEDKAKIRVLDLGCGAGNNVQFLAEKGFQVFGIDGSQTAIKICKNRFRELGLKGEFICKNFSKLPYRSDFFDLIIDRESLYANDLIETRKVMKEIGRVIKKGGKFISFAYNTYHPEMKLGRLINRNVYEGYRKGSTFFETGIVRFIDWKDLLKNYSFFKLDNVMRNSLSEVYNIEQKFMEYDEYIIIAHK